MAEEDFGLVDGNLAHRRRILVAEDDALLAETVDDVLRNEGFCVFIGLDGQAALEMAAQIKFDALLTDLHMPRMDGAALIRRLREGRRELPVIVMSGHAPADGISTLQRDGEGPMVLLEKPMTPRMLLQALNEVLPLKS